MLIKVCKTTEWSDPEWSSYCKNFNKVFQKDYSPKFFKEKYLNAFCGYSCHALLLDDVGLVVGCCTVVPVRYFRNKTIFKNGLCVDVFILEENRTDPLMLRKMYLKLKILLAAEDIVSVIAVPNATAYPYWKNVVKWKDVGCISYWMFPVRLGNVIHKLFILNSLTCLFSYFVIIFSDLLSTIFVSKERGSKYEIVLDEDFYRNRFNVDYQRLIKDSIKCYYRIVDEDGVITAYLISAKDNDITTFKAISKGVKHILRHHKVDLILYIGPLKLFQTIFTKSPRKLEPKLLPMTCDIIKKENIEKYSDMLVYKNWNFGLINYDVR